MQTQSEIARLRDAYRDYSERGLATTKWSLANQGNRQMRQERRRHLDELLCLNGLLPLTSRRILDLGCDTGELLAGFQDWGAGAENLFGVDLLAERIRIAKNQHPMIAFQQANAEDLPFRDRFFDIVCVFTVFSSILDQRMADNISREIERILTSDGAIIWYDFRIRSPQNPHVRGISRGEIQRLFPGFRMSLRTLTLVPPLARNLGATTPWLYPCLASLPFLRTHYLGVLTRRDVLRAPADSQSTSSGLNTQLQPNIEASVNGISTCCTNANPAPPGKRLYDLILASVGLVVLSPLFLVVALLIKLTDGGRVFYRQVRIGQHGQPFRICKFRTVIPNAEIRSGLLTVDGRSQATRMGRFLRKIKLDELPLLWNVWKGEMSLVGPRPEIPSFVNHYTREQRRILRYKPGLADLASLYFRNEESLLRNARDVERVYIERCLPRKLVLNQRYAESADLLSDTWILLQTICPSWIGLLLIITGALLASSLLLGSLLADGFVHGFSTPWKNSGAIP